MSRLAPLDHRARGWLRDLVAIRDEGMLAPLPLPLKTSLKYARARPYPHRRERRARPGRTSSAGATTGSSTASVPTPSTSWCGATRRRCRAVSDPGDDNEPTRFGAIAMRVWGPLLRERGGELVSHLLSGATSTSCRPSTSLGPLPTGTTLLEASAGTGKTFTVGALVTRYVAEGAATLDEMLVITFSRAATQELRTRVREQLDQRRASPRPAAGDGRRGRRQRAAGPPARRRPRRAGPRGSSGSATPWRRSTAPPSRPPTSSATSCSGRSASPARATPTADPRRVASTSWCSRWSTTSTSPTTAAVRPRR